MLEMMPSGRGQFGHRDTVGRIDEGGYSTLIHIKYLSSGSHGFRKEDFFKVSPL